MPAVNGVPLAGLNFIKMDMELTELFDLLHDFSDKSGSYDFLEGKHAKTTCPPVGSNKPNRSNSNGSAGANDPVNKFEKMSKSAAISSDYDHWSDHLFIRKLASTQDYDGSGRIILCVTPDSVTLTEYVSVIPPTEVATRV